MNNCGYFKAKTSVCLRSVQAVIHFVAEDEHRFERACKEHYAEMVKRIEKAGHEITEVSQCCSENPGANRDCCPETVADP